MSIRRTCQVGSENVGKYDAWRALFGEATADEFRLSIDQLEERLGSRLPRSARQHQAWWHGDRPHTVWEQCGFKASPSLRLGQVVFKRVGAPPSPGSSRKPTSPKARKAPFVPSIPESRRLVLVGCVKTKLPVSARAKDLYDSPLWSRRRSYAERTGMPWAILSAEHGPVDPEAWLEPYDRYLGDQPASFRKQWAEAAAAQVLERLRESGLGAVEVHAGSAYVNSGLGRRLEEAGVEVFWPLQGLSIGQQLGWYG